MTQRLFPIKLEITTSYQRNSKLFCLKIICLLFTLFWPCSSTKITQMLSWINAHEKKNYRLFFWFDPKAIFHQAGISINLSASSFLPQFDSAQINFILVRCWWKINCFIFFWFVPRIFFASNKKLHQLGSTTQNRKIPKIYQNNAIHFGVKNELYFSLTIWLTLSKNKLHKLLYFWNLGTFLRQPGDSNNSPAEF